MQSKTATAAISATTITKTQIASAFLFLGGALMAASMVASSSRNDYSIFTSLQRKCADNNCKASISACESERECSAKLKACAARRNKSCALKKNIEPALCASNSEISCAEETIGKKINFIKESKPEYVEAKKNEFGIIPMVLTPGECGDGILNSGEACDDGNTIGFDGCGATCKNIGMPNIKPFYCSQSLTYTITDQNGNPVKNATLTVYSYPNTDESGPLKSNFPFGDEPDYLIGLIAKSDEYGKVNIASNNLISKDEKYPSILWLHTFKITAPGFIGKFVPKRWCGIIENITIKLDTTESGDSITAESMENLMSPVKLFTDEFAWSKYEREDRTIMFPFVPRLRPDIQKNAESVDITMKIVTQPKGPVKKPLYLLSEQDKLFYKEYTNKNVSLDMLNKFEFTLPSGLYYFYFTFLIHEKNGTLSYYDFFPRYIMFGNTKPADVPDSFNFMIDSFSFFTSAVFVYPTSTFPQANFTPILADETAGLNQKINVVFFNSYFNKQDFNEMTELIVSGLKINLTNVEPFLSNKDKISYWRHEDAMDGGQTAWAWDATQTFLGKDISKIQQMYVNNNLPGGNTIFIVLYDDPSLTGEKNTKGHIGKCSNEKEIFISLSKKQLESCLSDDSMSGCVEKFDLGRLTLHEMGHALGALGEEYSDKQQLFNIGTYIKNELANYNPHKRQNLYYSYEIKPEELCIKSLCAGGEKPYGYSGNDIICHGANEVQCEKTPWHDLIGNGCGEDGKIDCADDPIGKLKEVSCHFGAGQESNTSYANIIKPTFASIMNFPGMFNYAQDKATDKTRVYGPVNERALCRAIEVYAGSSGGICEILCKKGCAKGERCVVGSCVPISEIK